MNNFDLITAINSKTNNRFNFLKLKQVVFNKSKNMCQIQLIYPSQNDLTDEDKDEIIAIIKEELGIDALLVVKINKSFVEKDLIKSSVLAYLKQASPIFYSGIIEGALPENAESNLQIEIFNDNCNDLQVKILLQAEQNLCDYFYKYKIDKNLVDFLSKNYCASFSVEVKRINNKEFDDKLLNDRVKEVLVQSEINSVLNYNQDKYVVSNKKVVLGDEIMFNPRVISSIKAPMEQCVVAGTINFLSERSYKSKKIVKKKDGTQEQVVKPYFSFNVRDSSGAINVVVFPSKAGYHKMNLLKDGNTVLIQGRVEKYNDKFEIMAKKISFCEVPTKNEIAMVVNQNDIATYRYVKPVKFTSIKQTNLFEEAKNYSPEVLNGSFVVYDFETTGIKPERDEIIEIGALKIVNGVFTEVFSTLVKPKQLIPPDATKINRITNEMVANCYNIEQVIQDFYLFCKDCQMVGYNNISFDSQFLNIAAKKVGLNFNNTQLDAFNLAKQKLKGLHNYKLATVSKFLEVNLIDAHRALNDVIATAEVFLKLY